MPLLLRHESTDVLGCQDPKMAEVWPPMVANTNYTPCAGLHSGYDQSVATGPARFRLGGSRHRSAKSWPTTPSR